MAKKKTTFIAYIGHDEVIVCKPKDEGKMVDELFGDDRDRDEDDYDCVELNDDYAIISIGEMSVE